MSCIHDPLAILEPPDDDAYYDTHMGDVDNPEYADHIAVVALHGNDGMRFLALGYSRHSPGVIRQNACLKCCLDLCRREDLRFVLC